MASYEEELSRLQTIVTADDSTDDQRIAARAAVKKLIDGQLDEIYARVKARTARYGELTTALSQIIDRIKANQVTTTLQDVDALIAKVKSAANA